MSSSTTNFRFSSGTVGRHGLTDHLGRQWWAEWMPAKKGAPLDLVIESNLEDPDSAACYEISWNGRRTFLGNAERMRQSEQAVAA